MFITLNAISMAVYFMETRCSLSFRRNKFFRLILDLRLAAFLNSLAELTPFVAGNCFHIGASHPAEIAYNLFQRQLVFFYPFG